MGNIESSKILLNKINSSNKILIICARPADQDCISSGLTLNWFIKKKFNKDSKVVIFTQMTDRLRNFPSLNKVKVDFPTNINYSEYDLIISVDGGDWSRVFMEFGYEKIVQSLNLENCFAFDHHYRGSIANDLGERCIQQLDCCCGKIIYEYFIKDSDVELETEVATWLMFGLIDDTKRFIHEVYEDTFLYADALKKAGADLVLATDESSNIESIKFTAWAIENTEFYPEIQTTILRLTRQKCDELEILFGKSWYTKDYDRHYVETIERKIYGYNYGLLFQNDEKTNATRAGWRTRTYGENKIELKLLLSEIGFKAGGHLGAGGGTNVDDSIDVSVDKFINAMKSKFKK